MILQIIGAILVVVVAMTTGLALGYFDLGLAFVVIVLASLVFMVTMLLSLLKKGA